MTVLSSLLWLFFQVLGMDWPERSEKHINKTMEKRIGKAISNVLDETGPVIVFSSAACGLDILFIEEVLRKKAEVNIVLPIPKEQFVKEGTDFISKAQWKIRLEKVIQKASRVYVASDRCQIRNTVTDRYAGLIQNGLTILRAGALDTEIIPLTMPDDRHGAQTGDTFDFVQYWRSYGMQPKILELWDIYEPKDARGRSQGQ